MIKEKLVGKIKYIVLALSAASLTVGILLEQNTDMLTKAVKICLECIGIG